MRHQSDQPLDAETRQRLGVALGSFATADEASAALDVAEKLFLRAFAGFAVRKTTRKVIEAAIASHEARSAPGGGTDG